MRIGVLTVRRRRPAARGSRLIPGPEGRVAGGLSGPRLIAAALAAAAFVVAPGSGRTETLAEALAQAYQNNPRLLSQRAQLRATDEQVPQALSNFRPTITGRANIGKSNVKAESSFFSSKENRSPRAVGANISQPIFRGFRSFAQVRQAEATVRAERARLRGVEQEVFLAGATAYVNVVRDEAVLELNTNNEQVLRRRLQATRDRFEVGEVTRTDVAQAEARLARAIADRIQGRGTLESSRANFENVVGHRPSKLSQPAERAGLPVSLAEAIEIAIDNNPDVVAAGFTEQAARHQVNNVFGELLPTITLEGDVSKSNDASTKKSKNTTFSVTARLSVPLYQSGSVSSRVREAKQQASQRRTEIATARRNAIEAATRAWETLQTARARIVALRSEVRANEIAHEGVTQEAAAGLRTVLDVLDAEQELLDSRVGLVRVRRDDVVARFELWLAMGRLTAADLKLSVENYDANAHYQSVRGQIFGTGDPLPPPDK